MLMCSMCASGVMKALTVIGFSFCSTTQLLSEHLPLCVWTYVMSSANSLVGLSTISALALDRLIAVTYHLRYQDIVTPKRCSLFIVLQVCMLVNLYEFVYVIVVHCVHCLLTYQSSFRSIYRLIAKRPFIFYYPIEFYPTANLTG